MTPPNFSPVARNNLRIEWVPITALKRNPRNPRKHSKRQIRLLMKSIEAFAFVVPAIVNDDGRVLAGDARLQAAQKLHLHEVPVIRARNLSAEQQAAFAIADNRLSELAAWDGQALGEILSELAAIDLSFDLEATGFTMGEIDLIIEGLSGDDEGATDDEDTVDTSGPPVAKPGDLWLAGKHRIFCGDARDPASFNRLMQGEKAQAVFTDSPYNVRIHGHVSGKGKVHHREFAMASGEMPEQEFALFLATVLQNLSDNTIDGSLAFACIDWRHVGDLLAAGKKAYSSLLNICVWVKDKPGMGSLYRSQHELIAVFKRGRAPHRNNIELGRFGRNRSNVWQYPCANTFSRSGDEGNLAALHPTVKPLGLVRDAIQDCTARGDVVLDAFLGSGTTLIAAERVGRRCYGIEIDPLYVDAAIRRWERHSGDRAILADSGRAFGEIEAEAEDEGCDER
jgi:DNA modification methylase